MVVADRQADRDALVEATGVLADALPERLQRLEPVARPRGVDANSLAGAVIDGH
jgi:hypothetical protein